MALHHDSARGSRSGSIKTFGLAQSMWAHAALVAFLGLLVYSNTFSSLFVFDDYPIISRLKTAWARRTAVCFLALALVFLAAGAYKRNMVWKSEISLWGDAVRKHPDNARARYNLGSAYGSMEQFGKAVEHILVAIKIEPDFPQAYNNLGLVYGSQGRMEDAGECFRKAIEIYPGFAEAHNNMGIVYSAMGQYGKAIESFGAALRLRPDNPDVHYNMGKAYSEIGLMDKAGFHFRRAEELKRASGNSE